MAASTCCGTIARAQNRFAGIVAQEYSAKEQELVGERVNIFEGTPLGLTEAPHLYKRDGWYYLLTAEGGTAWNHAVTMARSQKICWDRMNCTRTPPSSAPATGPMPRCSAPAMAIWWRRQDGET